MVRILLSLQDTGYRVVLEGVLSRFGVLLLEEAKEHRQ